MTDIKNGQEDGVSPELENLLGRKPISLTRGAESTLQPIGDRQKVDCTQFGQAGSVASSKGSLNDESSAYSQL